MEAVEDEDFEHEGYVGKRIASGTRHRRAQCPDDESRIRTGT